MASTLASSFSSNNPKLLDRVRDTCLFRHYSIRTEEAYSNWINPVVLTRPKVLAVLSQLSGKYRLMVDLLYGAGLRLSTTQAYTPVLNRPGLAVKSPLDAA